MKSFIIKDIWLHMLLLSKNMERMKTTFCDGSKYVKDCYMTETAGPEGTNLTLGPLHGRM